MWRLPSTVPVATRVLHGCRARLLASAAEPRARRERPQDILRTWRETPSPQADQHVAALFNLGRATRGRGAGESRADWERHDAMQLGLQDDPAFAELLMALRDAIPSLAPKGLSRLLMGLGDTHEDLPFAHPTTPPEHMKLLLSVVEVACERLLSTWAEGDPHLHDDRDLGFPLFALSRLGLYNEEIFNRASALLSLKLTTSEQSSAPLAVEGLRQWLLACNNVNHSLAEHEGAIARYRPQAPWQDEEGSRLHQLAGTLAFLVRPDPLLGEVLREVNRRPASQLQASKAVALYGLQAVRLLTENGALQTEERLDAALAEQLDYWLEEKTRRVHRSSQLENAVGTALSRSGFQPAQDVTVGHGLSADFRCSRRGQSFFVEVDGPSHFCVRPPWRPRGRTLLKRRIFASLGHDLVSVPYWVAAAPGAYARRGDQSRRPDLDADHEELGELISEQLDALNVEKQREAKAER
ncbi:unnamed protein product [Polarella glacialis]|uniref:RAP domain-containing protein n=1 Tax=Polarella glacialis TaxID=89957 RepID=A0A813HEL4_POLGL|nr:unnamed protein product [Polarella glacialis]